MVPFFRVQKVMSRLLPDCHRSDRNKEDCLGSHKTYRSFAEHQTIKKRLLRSQFGKFQSLSWQLKLPVMKYCHVTADREAMCKLFGAGGKVV